VAGQQLTSNSVRIRCGLGKADIERVTTQALGSIDLSGLVEKARQGQLEDQAAVGALVERLGVDAPKIIQALQQLGREGKNDARLTERLAAIVSNDAKVETVTADPSAPMPDPPAPAAAPSRSPARSHAISQEAKTLRADCAAIAQKAKVDVVDIRCGPSEAQIRGLVSQIVEQTDPAGLVKLAMQGGDPNAPQVAALGKQLGLTNDSIAQILAKLEKDRVPDEQLTNRFAALTRQHMDFVLHASGLATDSPAIKALREQAITALGKGDYGQTEALLTAAELTQRQDAVQSSALTLAAQNNDRGRELLQQSHDYDGAARLFAAAAARVPAELPLVRAAYLIDQGNALIAGAEASGNKENSEQALSLLHEAYAFMVMGFGAICPQTGAGTGETYEAKSKDGRVTWTLNCPVVH
jgi:hypothetical protein